MPKIAISSQNSPFYNKIMWFWLLIHMLIRLLGLKNAIFVRFWRFFAYFLWERGPKNFFGVKIFFSNKLTQSRPKTTYFVVITHFGKLCLISPQNWKTHFYPFSPIIWIQAEYRGPKNLGDNALCLLCYQNPSIFWWFRPIRTKIHQKIMGPY